MKKPKRVVLVDDDPRNHLISQYVIKKVSEETEILAFTLPEEAIEFIESSYTAAEDCATVMLLDINMPGMSGWEFLDRYEKAPSAVKEQFAIYLLSSSIDQRDLQRAKANANLRGFLMKPLIPEMAKEVIKCFAESPANGGTTTTG